MEEEARQATILSRMIREKLTEHRQERGAGMWISGSIVAQAEEKAKTKVRMYVKYSRISKRVRGGRLCLIIEEKLCS